MKRTTVFFLLILLGCVCSVAYSQDQTTDIRLNQVGFLPNATKLAVVNSTTATTYEIKTSDLKKTVFKGTLSNEVFWKESDEKIKIADFSSFAESGSFVVLVPDKGKSYPFTIKPDIFVPLLKGSIKAFYYNRCSTPLLAQHAGQFARPTGHPDNEVIVHASAATAIRPAGTKISTPYGWYDAGDYNKYIVNSGISTFSLLAAYESFPTFYDTLQLNIPESNNTIPDLLDEALWNIRWMFTMQDPNDGGVYNKTTNANFDGMVMPEKATAPRYVVDKGTAAALDFAAIMAMTARVYKKYLPEFADSCLQKAKYAWTWAKTNPDVAFRNPKAIDNFPAVSTGGYGDRNFSDEFSWAATELYITTKEDNYYSEIQLTSTNYDIPGWPNVRTLGLLSLISHRKQLSPIADTAIAIQKLLGLANPIKDFHKTASPYRITHNNFFWGSNSMPANQGMILSYAFQVTHNYDYFNAALSALDYLLGRNATTFSFVTGFGTKYPMHIHHRPTEADGIVEPIPGFLAGGPNPQNTDDCGGMSAYPSSLPALCYADKMCSYSTNEIAINWNAPLVFIVGSVQANYLQAYSANAPAVIKKK